jgi:methionyl-tRNA synthetase
VKTIGLVAEILRICGIGLQPYMPTKASMMLDLLGVEKSQRTWKDAVVGSNKTYGKSFLTSAYGKGHESSLFPKAMGFLIPVTKPVPEADKDEKLPKATKATV